MTELFHLALEREASEVGGFLAEACAGDGALLEEVERLVAAHRRATGFLQAPAFRAWDEPAAAELPPLPDEAFGPYRVVREIGRGGMGAVYLAERSDQQYRKQVAIKLIKRGMDTESVLRRFRNERQILAGLEHPHIARLLDGGTSASGLPYFVMEYVPGQPIDVFCNERKLSVTDRLQLFLKACSAVSYAHQRLVVHRDLKPSNIVVSSEGVPKLLDFGIARLMSGDGEGETLTTAEGPHPMTPEYASPEQVQGLPATTLSDVYSLGVLLYELLTGRSPYSFWSRAPEDFIPAVLAATPEKPSAVVMREGTSERLRRQLRGDLDNIVLMALRKEPTRRYASVEHLSQDLQRHLVGRPVAARPDTLSYRAAKFIRRNRLAVGAATLLLASLAAGLVTTVWQAHRARVQEGVAKAAQARAEGEARKAEAVKEFLKSLFSASNPDQAQGKERTARQLLDDGAVRIERELEDQPEVQSEVARLIAEVYGELGDHDRARPLLTADLERRRRAEGPRSLAVAESLTQLADVIYEQGEFEEAGRLYQQALDIQRAERGERAPQLARLLIDVATIRRLRGDYAGAVAMQEQALAIYVETKGDDTHEAMFVREGLAITYSESDRHAEALAMQEPVAAWQERRFGLDHPDRLNSRRNCAHILLALGRAGEAQRVIEDVVTRERRVLGERHDRLARSLRLLARAGDEDGQGRRALPVIAEALSIHRERFGGSHLQVALDLSTQGLIEAHTGLLGDGDRHCRAALAFFDGHAGSPPSYESAARLNAGIVLAEAGRLDEADRLLGDVVRSARSRGHAGLSFARALDALGDVARRRGQTARAVELGREALVAQERGHGEETRPMALARVHTGAALCAAGQPAEGERLLREGLAWLERSYPGGHPDLAAARMLLGEALEGTGRLAEARGLLQSALEWRQAHFGPSDPRTKAIRRALGSSTRPS